MRSQQYDEINDSSDTEAEHLVDSGSSPATPHSPWRNAGVAMSVCGAIAFVLAVYSNPSAHGGSVSEPNMDLIKAMNDVSAVKASSVPHTLIDNDPERQHLINGDDTDDAEEDPMAMTDDDACGKGATCAPSPPPTWRAHGGESPTVALTAFPTPTPEPTNHVQLHENTPAPQPVWHFPTKSPSTSTPSLSPTYHKSPSYDWPTYQPTSVPTVHRAPTQNPTPTPKPTLKPTFKPTHLSPTPDHDYEPTAAPHPVPTPDHDHEPTAAPTRHPVPTPDHDHEPTVAPSREKHPAHGSPTHAPSLDGDVHPAPTPDRDHDTVTPTSEPTHHKAPTPEPQAADDDDGTANARSSGHGHGSRTIASKQTTTKSGGNGKGR